MNGDGRRVVDLRRGPRLVRQPAHGPPPLLFLGIPGHPGLLDGDEPIVLLVASPPHRATRPRPDPFDKSVPSTDQTSAGRVFAVFTHGT